MVHVCWTPSSWFESRGSPPKLQTAASTGQATTTGDIQLSVRRVSVKKFMNNMRQLILTFQNARDAWDVEESIKFYKGTLQIDDELGLAGRVTHETHRNRSLFTPYATQRILEAVPE